MKGKKKAVAKKTAVVQEKAVSAAPKEKAEVPQEKAVTAAPEGFAPIAGLKPDFKQASYVASHSKIFTFLDTEQGEVKGYVQRYDRSLSGPVKEKNVFLTVDHKPLNKVTHFK